MIVDEDEPYRQELEAMVTPSRIAVVAESGYGIQALSLAEETRPDLVLTAVGEPVSRAVKTIAAIRSALPDVPVIAYSSSVELSLVRQVMHAGAKDLLSAPVRQADLLAAIEMALKGSEDGEQPGAAPAAAGTVITVFGAKGGIGKTTITTNIGSSIAKSGNHSVLIIDLDTRFGDVAIMLDVEPHFTVAQLATRVDTLDRATFKSALVQHESGVYVLPAPKHPNEWRSVTAEEIKELVKFATRMFDYVILDTPGAFNDIVGVALEVATQVLVVTSVDMASIKDTSFILDLMDSEAFSEDRQMLVVNHANGSSPMRTGDIERVLQRKVYWEIPHSQDVSLSSQLGRPIVLAKPHSKAAVNLSNLATKLTGRTINAAPPKGGLFRRLLPLHAG